MNETDEKTQINFTVDTDAKELAKDKLEYGELSSELRQKVRQIAFGEEISKREQASQHLAELREEKDQKRAKKREIEAELEDIESKIARIEERLDNMERKEDKYETSLEMLEETLYGGGRVFEDHGQVIKASKLGDREPEEVVEELRERNPSIPEHAFVSGLKTDRTWSGVSEGEGEHESGYRSISQI